MSTTAIKSNDKVKRDTPTKDDLVKTPQNEPPKKASYTPRTYLQKSTTADIYGQKKRTMVHSAKAPKKSPSTSYITSNTSPMKDLLQSSPSSTSHISTRSERPKIVQKKIDAKSSVYSVTPRSKDFNVTVNSPIVKRKLNMDLEKEKSFIRDISKGKKEEARERSLIKEFPKSNKLKDREKSFIKDVLKENKEKVREKSFIKDVSKDKKERVKEKSFTKEVHKNKNDTGREKSFVRDVAKENKDRVKEKSFIKDKERDGTTHVSNERQRTKTRTLDQNEVKMLTSEAVDNNFEMFNLSRKLGAIPKAFYIDLDEGESSCSKKTPPSKDPSDEDDSYEDDFESYESDFESYHSTSPSDHNDASDEQNEEMNDEYDESNEAAGTLKEVKDDEKMLDSGSFDLRDPRSANKTKPAVMDFILETAEGIEKPTSLTDEGFQEMSSSSAVSSMRTVHVDVLDRPLFIDFTKSKENRRKKRIGDRLRQRAKDLLSIITLHEMSYSLFEMKPISYDLYMATFGKSNYTQIAVQTFDDGVSEEIQTDEVEFEHKWTQHPVEFTKNDICIKDKVESRKYSRNTEDYLTKFTFLTTQSLDVELNNAINIDNDYKTDPLRIYFEQRDGVGPSEMLPYEIYKSKLKNNDHNTNRLAKFLKKIESRISNVLNTNSGNTELSALKVTKFPFSKGYVSISTKQISDEKLSFLNNTNISQMYFSETKSNLLMTVHKTSQNIALKKCTVCLWDISVATREPIKILTAIDNIAIARFRGARDGYFVAALEDSSIHVWDLSEEPTWREDDASEEKPTELGDINEGALTKYEDWNKKNTPTGSEAHNIRCALQSCAYTNSAHNMSNVDATDCVVGLALVENSHSAGSQEGRKIVGQVISLQRIGVLTIWSIVQQKSKAIPPDIGKAFLSKMKLQKNQTISLLDHIDIPLKDVQNGDSKLNFNLNAAKRRMINRKQEKYIVKKEVSRPKSAISFDFDIDRPSSATSAKLKRVLSIEKYLPKNWESGIVCGDLKVMSWKNCDHYLIAKNCGEALCCKRILGAVKVSKFFIATDASSVTCIEVSPHRLPFFLAATDTGTISVCSLLDNRVLLTLDCRNIQPQDVEKCQSDQKGRYVSSVSTRAHVHSETRGSKLSVTSLSWSHINPCCLFASLLDGSIVEWELSYSDIYAKCASDAAATACTAGDSTLALLTPEGEVHVHKLTNEHKTKEFLLLFEKYVALL